MPSKINDAPNIYLEDGTSIGLDGCTIVHPPVALAPVIALHRTEDLTHLVRWAYDHGYGCRSLSLTLTWNRDELEEEHGCRISDDFLDAAQEWLDATSGGFAAATGAEPLCGNLCDLDVADTFDCPDPDPQPWDSSVQVTEDAWEARFSPGDLRDLDDEEVLRSDAQHVWTMVDDPHGDGCLIVAGRYDVNRVGYFVAEHPWDDFRIFVRLD